ncbi:hypothetical protein HDU97_000866 [Phlyctochytrium planicorne]|nr:hypothetical protein HDU97_000866 [Phlyctochytrium planicorne]
MGCGASKAGGATVDTHQPAASSQTKKAVSSTPAPKTNTNTNTTNANAINNSGDAPKYKTKFVDPPASSLENVNTAAAPKRTKTVAPVIAAFDDDGSPLGDDKLAYQGGEDEAQFVQGFGENDPEIEPTQWVVLAPGEIPADVDPEAIPKHYFQEEAARIQKELDEEAQKAEEEQRRAKMRQIYGVSNPDLANDIPVGIQEYIEGTKAQKSRTPSAQPPASNQAEKVQEPQHDAVPSTEHEVASATEHKAAPATEIPTAANTAPIDLPVHNEKATTEETEHALPNQPEPHHVDHAEDHTKAHDEAVPTTETATSQKEEPATERNDEAAIPTEATKESHDEPHE